MIDNYDLFEMNEARIAKETMHRPMCSCCNRPIMDDYAYEIENGLLVCAECLDDEYKVYIDDEEDVWE